MTRVTFIALVGLASACERRAEVSVAPLTTTVPSDAVTQQLVDTPNTMSRVLPIDAMLSPDCPAGRTSMGRPRLPWPGAIPGEVTMAFTWCVDSANAARAWYPSGADAADGEGTLATPQGTWTYFYPSGEKVLEGTYRDGRADKLWRAFERNGNVREVACFANGEKRWTHRSDDPSPVPNC